MAIQISGRVIELREVHLKNKPESMLKLSEKGTVPVLHVEDKVIDESLDVMRWALSESDVDQWDVASLGNALITGNDGEFKYWLDRYKYFERYPEYPQAYYLRQAGDFLARMESKLARSGLFLNGDTPQALDIAIFPFIRQFAHTDLPAFKQLPYPSLQVWLNYWLNSNLFAVVMTKCPVWEEGEEGIKFGEHK